MLVTSIKTLVASAKAKALFATLALLLMVSALGARGASAQTADAGDLIPASWTFAALVAQVTAVGANDLISGLFLALLALFVLGVVIVRVKRMAKSSR